MKFKIAVVQLSIKPFAPNENLKKAEKYISKAASKADIIVFPEDFITGPIEGKKRLIDRRNKYRKHFQYLAKKYNINIIPGSIIESYESKIYNTTYYINSDGKVKLVYRKVNLWGDEKKYFNSGDEAPVVKTKFGRIGLIICWDLAFNELFRKMINKSVDLVICPSYWTFEAASVGLNYDKNADVKFVDALCVGRAYENEIILVFCNAAGKWVIPNYTETLLGHSQITVPFKGVIRKLEHNKEQMFIQEVDTRILKDAEKAYRIRADLKEK